MGKMGASFILFTCWFVLILFGPIVFGENLRNGALPKLSEGMKREMQRLESFSGRKFGYTHRFSTGKMLVSVMESGEKEERGVLVRRTLLAENTTKHESLLLQKTETKNAEDKAEKGKNLQIQDTSLKGTKEIGQNSTKPEDKSVKQIPVMGTILPDHSNLGRKGNNTERSEAKIEKLQDGVKINSVQKPLKNRTEQNTNNGSENTTKNESPLLQKTLTKKAKDETELEKKLQIKGVSSMRTQEISQASKKPVDGSVKKIPVTETIHPDHSTLGGKDNDAGRYEAKVEKLQNGEKVNSVQKPLVNRTEHSNNNGSVNTTKDESPLLQKTETGKKLQIQAASSKGPKEISQNSTNPKDGSVREFTVTETTHPDHSNLGGKDSNAERFEAQKENFKNVEKVNSVQNPLNSRTEQNNDNGREYVGGEPAKDTKKIIPNSTGTGVQKIDSDEARNRTGSAKIQIQNTEIAKSTESEALENPEIKQTESSEDSTDAEAERIERIKEEFSVNSTDTMTSTEFEDSANSTAMEMQWRAQNSRNNKDVEIDGPEDEYNDLIQEFTDLPSKIHDTAEKVADQLMPGIKKFSNKSKIYFSRANEGIVHGFRPLVGQHYAAFVASGISCTFLLVPLLVAIIVFEQIRSFFPLQKVILLANIYLANYFATLVFTSFIIGMEPLEFFYKNSVSGYIYLQLLQELGFLLYLSMQCFNVVATWSKRRLLLAKLGSVVQLSVAVCIGLHYYVTVFQRAMAQKPPRTCWRVHVVYSLLFVILCLLSRIRHGKKEYLQAADYNTNKKN